MSSVVEEIAQLVAAIAAQEALRLTLGDAVVNAAVAAMRTQLSVLQATPAAQTLDLHLQVLQNAELIRPFALHSDPEYIFKRALTQDAAYGSLLFSERKALHAVVARVLESGDVQRTGPQASHIAEHHFRAEAWDKASGYLVEAGDAAARAFAHPEARLHYARALEALSHLSDMIDTGAREVLQSRPFHLKQLLGTHHRHPMRA